VLSFGNEGYVAFVILCFCVVDNLTTLVFCKPDFPVFSKEYDPLFCALIIVGLGCNLNLGGVKSIGPSTMYKLLAEINRNQLTLEERFNCLLLSLSGNSNKKGSAGQPSTVTKSSHDGALKSKHPPIVYS